MITIVHGDDVISSRNYYLEQKNTEKNYITFDGGSLTLESLVKSIEGGSLFGTENVIFIENFLLNNKSKATEEIIDYLNLNSKNCRIYIWEDQEVKRISIIFKTGIAKLFKLPQNLFAFLDSLKPSNPRSVVLFHEVLKNLSEDAIFYMLIRQFRLMLSLVEYSKENIDEARRLAPWQISKLKHQALGFGKEKLIDNYRKLYQIDLGYKSGSLAQTLSQNIDFFLLDL